MRRSLWKYVWFGARQTYVQLQGALGPQKLSTVRLSTVVPHHIGHMGQATADKEGVRTVSYAKTNVIIPGWLLATCNVRFWTRTGALHGKHAGGVE